MPKTTNGSEWKTISIQPLSGGLDIRSRPADIPVGWLRWKLNLQVTPLGKLCRRGGFSRAWEDFLYDDNGVRLSDPAAGPGIHYHNHDLHRQGQTREQITMLYENTWDDKTRQLFAGTQSSIFMQHEDTGYWDTLLSGAGAFPSVWRAATLQDVVYFANGVDDIQAYPNGGPISTIPELLGLQVTAAHVIIEFSGFIFIMNMTQGGVSKPTRVRWSDLNNGMAWDPSTLNTLANFQDLPYGDEIIGAGVLLGGLYIFTRRAIWRCTVGIAPATFSFTRVYNEPKNQTGCLVYPYTLVSDGQNFHYASRDAIYHWNPYMTVPERKESDGNDWLYRASGVMFTKTDTAMSGVLCNLPVAEFLPTTRELWISWPTGANTVNNLTMVAQIDQKTADVVDHGFTAMSNFRRVPTAAGLCNDQQYFLAVSGEDWAIKDIGGVFYRELAAYDPADPSKDLDLETSYRTAGYYSEMRGMVPLGYTDREKCIRNILVDDDTSEQDVPDVVNMKLGTSYKLSDPNDLDDICAVQWEALGTVALRCQDAQKISEMKAANLRSNVAIEFPCFYQGRFLYFWLRIETTKGNPPIGSDTCLERMDFDVLLMPKG